MLYAKFMAIGIIWLGASSFFLKTTNQLTEEDIFKSLKGYNEDRKYDEEGNRHHHLSS